MRLIRTTSNIHNSVTTTLSVRLAAATLLLFLAALSLSADSKCEETTSTTLVAGKIYSNADYGYSLVIPNSAVGCESSPPSPNHGLKIVPGNSSAALWVDGSYNAAEYKSAHEALAKDIDYIRSDHPTARVIKIRFAKATIGHLPAWEAIVTLRDGTAQQIKEMRVVAIRPDSNGIETGIVYTIGLTASATNFASAKSYADKLLDGIVFH